MMPNMDSLANGGVESSAESPAPTAEAEEEPVTRRSPAAVTKGRGLRRWRRIRRDQLSEDYAAAGSGGGEEEDSAQLHKRRLPLGASDVPKGKHETAPVEAESSTASVESRFIPAPPRKLDPGLGFLIASAGFSIGAGGADSDNSEDRGSRYSTATSAPRAFTRDRAALPRLSAREEPPRRAPACRQGDFLLSYTEAENSRSSTESDLRSSNDLKARQLGAGGTSNGVHKVLSDYRGHNEEGQPSEDVRSTAAGGYYKENGSSVVGRLARRSSDSGDDAEEALDDVSVGKGQINGRMHPGGDPYAESVLLLQRTQDALENEIEKFVAIGKEPSDDFDVHDDEWSGSVYLQEPIEEVCQRIKHLESRLEEALTLTKEKDSRILEVEALVRMQSGTAVESTNLALSQSEVDRLYQEKMEAEIHCIILTRANQTWETLTDDQIALYEVQKSLSQDYKQLRLKLRHTENRAMMLEEMAEKLQVQCKELSRSSEILQLQSQASRVSLFCFVQFVLLCVAIGTYLMRLLPSSTEVVPT